MGSSIPDDWKLRGQAAGRQHLTTGEVRDLFDQIQALKGFTALEYYLNEQMFFGL